MSLSGSSPAPFYLPKLICSSIAVYCIVSSGVTEVWILFIYKPNGASSMQVVWPARNLRTV